MSNFQPFGNYQVFFTPLVQENVYGSTVDVTQDIDLTDFIKSLGRITQEIDNGDYEIGIYTFGNITLTGINYERKFNDAHDWKSIFPFMRDKCKVEVKFFDKDGNSQTTFKGLINDDATRVDIQRGLVKFKVLSLDSIFRQVSVPDGAIVAGDTFSTAIKKIINVPEITSILDYSASNIVTDLDVAIDDGETFSSRNVKSALDDLLLASNSILYVDNADNVYVKARTESANIFYLYGASDPLGRENILDIKNYNSGVHRSYSSVAINDDTVVNSLPWIEEYGFRQKSLNFDFITNIETEETIAARILDYFKVPKPELEITVPTKDVDGIEVLDLVSIDYNYRPTPAGNDLHLPKWGLSTWGSFYYPKETGSFKILPKVKWKVIKIETDARNFTTTLKLRQAGIESHTGYFT